MITQFIKSLTTPKYDLQSAQKALALPQVQQEVDCEPVLREGVCADEHGAQMRARRRPRRAAPRPAAHDRRDGLDSRPRRRPQAACFGAEHAGFFAVEEDHAVRQSQEFAFRVA